MKTRIVQIGNSRGIRLPKVLIEEAQLEEEVELAAEPGPHCDSPREPTSRWLRRWRLKIRERNKVFHLDPGDTHTI